MTTLLDYWPTMDRVNECVRSDADAASDAVLLAVHRRMKLRRVEPGGVSEEVGEQAVRDFLLRPDPPDGRVLVPIEGSSGVGKSHLVRWLSIQARHGTGKDGRHVIAIPKGAGLRKALGLMLDGLDGPRYDRIRAALNSAREKISDTAAEVLIRANLEIGLRERVAETLTRLKTHEDRVRAAQKLPKNVTPDRETQALLNDVHLTTWLGPGLVEWINNPATTAPLLDPKGPDGPGILAALAKRVVQGNRPADDGPELRSEFRDADFLIGAPPPGVSKQLQRTITNLNAAPENGGPAYRAQAVRVLNELVDQAVARLIQPSDHNVSELFEQVRAELFKDGKELVLLVEDFANLAGIQGALFQAMIADATWQGKRRLCDVRAAFAVTPGYMDKYDTGQTRAVYRWVIDDVPPGTERDLLDGVVELAAGYLNAARVGEAELNRRLAAAGDPDSGWLPTFDPAEELPEADRKALEAFGRSTSGRPLFPFNPAALHQLARHHLKEGERLIFKPRYVITRFLQPILREFREAFARGEFPPPTYTGYSPNRLGAEVIRGRLAGLPADRRGRYEVLLGFWGGLPQTLDQLRLPAEVYRAFNLDPLSDGPAEPPVVQPQPGQPSVPAATAPVQPQVVAPPTPTITAPTEADRRLAVLREWRQGKQRLTQTPSRALRADILRGVKAAIDWDALLLEPLALDGAHGHYLGWVYLPNADGVEEHCTPENALATVCTPADLADPDRGAELELDLRAILRFHEHGSFDYDGGEDDFARYGAFMARAAEQASAFLAARYLRVEADPVPPLVQALALGARVLDIPNAHATDDADLLEAVFTGASPSGAPPGATAAWEVLRSHAAQNRGAAQDTLLQLVAARQGGSKMMHALDAARLLAPLRELRKSWKLDRGLPDLLLTTPTEWRQAREYAQRLQSNRVEPALAARRQELEGWRKRAVEWFGFGPGFDKEQLVQDMLGAISSAVALGDVFEATVTHETLQRRVRDFRGVAVAETVRDLERLTPDTRAGTLLSVLSRADDAVLDAVTALMDEFDTFLDRTGKRLRGRLTTELGTDDLPPPEELAGRIEEVSEEPVRRARATAEDHLTAVEKAARALPEEGP